VYEAVQADVNRLGGAAMQTEGMQCSGVQSECENNRNALDDRLFSWIDWNFSMDNGTEAASWARTYAHAVAGVPLNMSFDPHTKEFHFCYQLETAVQAPTVVFASTKYNYPEGFVVSTTVNVNASVDGDLVYVAPAFHDADGGEACIHVVPE
jgi:endoglycosylceramidase